MNIFEKAFNRQRSTNYKRGGRQLSEIGRMLKEQIPQYLVFYNSAIDSYNSGQVQNALNLIEKTIEHSDIDDWKHFAFKANVLEDLQKYGEAIKSYETAIDIEGDDVRVYALYHQIGFCYFVTGDNPNAVKFYSLALDLKEQHPNSEFNPDQEGMDMGVMIGIAYKKIHNNRASAFLKLGKLDESFEDCMAAINLDKTYSNPYLTLADIYSKKGREQQGIELLKIAAQYGNKNAIITLQKLGWTFG